MTSQTIKAFACFLMSVAIVTAAYCFAFVMWIGFSESKTPFKLLQHTGEAFTLAGMIAWVALPIALGTAIVVMFLVGVPFVIISNKLGLTSFKYYLISGIIIILTLELFADFAFTHSPDRMLVLPDIMLVGIISTIVYWKKARPDLYISDIKTKLIES